MMIEPTQPMKTPCRQRGAAALAVAMVLLFGMTLIAFFASRGMLFEQRTSANQFRSTSAFEIAEAGLEWAAARLNDEHRMLPDASCSPTGSGTNASYAERYVPILSGPPISFDVKPTRSGCSIAADGTLACSCPLVGNQPNFGNPQRPRFAVRFNFTADPLSVEVVSTGCTSEGTACDGTATPSDAVAVVRALYKMKPVFPNAPGAGLVTGGAAGTGGNFIVHNTDVESNGITINSGTTVDLGGGTSVTTLGGTPPRASVLDNDPSLAALTNAPDGENKFFASFFGESLDQYKDNPKTYIVTSGSCAAYANRCSTCSNDNNCAQAVTNAYTDKGFERFWTDHTADFNNGNRPAATAENPDRTIGTANRPVAVATSQAIKIGSNLVAYGLFYAATATAYDNWEFPGSGSAKVFGAFVSRGDFVKNAGSGTLDLIYDPNIFRPDKMRGLMVRVPGSWRDKSSEF